MKSSTGVCAVAMLACMAPAFGQNNQGAVTSCIACHGKDGAGNAALGYPKLAGQNAAYIVRQLQDFKSGARKNPVMQPIASGLSTQAMQAAAQYYAAQKAGAARSPAPAAKQGAEQQGQELAQRGDWNQGIPSCFSCHGPQAQGVGSTFPALAGQHASYIASQIKAWQQGTRSNDPESLMKAVATRLNAQQIADVSLYLSTLSPHTEKSQ